MPRGNERARMGGHEQRSVARRGAPELPLGSASDAEAEAEAAEERARRPPASHANAGRPPPVAMQAAAATAAADESSEAIESRLVSAVQ